MKKVFSSVFLVVCTLCFSWAMLGSASATVTADTLDSAIEKTAAYLQETVTSPTISSIGGEWTILGLARGCDLSQTYADTYYQNVVRQVREQQGVLHQRKYSEYARVAIALTAIGKDPRSVGGYNLLMPLGDYEKTVYQGINGAIFALIALDCGDYEVPVNSDAEVQASRELYVQYILDRQLTDGGWALGGTAADPDVTAMALQALSNYQTDSAVKEAVSAGLLCLSRLQNADGGFASWGAVNCESTVQVIVALGELEISLTDSRFVKNGNTLLDHLFTYVQEDGSFLHVDTGDGGNSLMSTEQGLYGMAAAQRLLNGENSLYDMGDVESGGRHPDVQQKPIVAPGKTFADIAGHANQDAIEALAERGVINGMNETTFAPDATMTRAEFATIVVRGLGLPEQAVTVFQDLKKNAWYCGTIGSAYTYGIVKGTSDTTFDPNSTITREEAATMVARAAALCGLDTAMSETAVTAALAAYGDRAQISAWATEALAYCKTSGIFDAGQTVQPQTPVLRGEIAQMLYQMLDLADLL